MIYDEAKVKKCYELSANVYAERYYHELDHKPFDRNLLAWYADLIPPGEGVVDMGCGPGEIANFLFQQGVNVSGVDLSKNMVQVARKLNPHITYVQDNMLYLQTAADQSLFGIVAFYAIVHFTLKEVEIAFGEFKRILKPGGYILLSFHVGQGVVSEENFLDQKGAAADFMFFEIDDILDIVNKVSLTVEEVLVRYPYPGKEYESKRAYLLLKNNDE